MFMVWKPKCGYKIFVFITYSNIQITLDIDAFGREVELLGVDPISLRSYRELKDLKADIATQIAAANHQS